MRGYCMGLIWIGLLAGCASAPHHPPQESQKLVAGSRTWSHAKIVGVGLPVVDGTLVYTADPHHLSAHHLQTGRLQKNVAYPGAFSTGPAVDATQWIIGTQKGEVVAFDSEKGTVRWTRAVSADLLAAPVIAADRVYLHALDGTVFALNAKDGSESWVYHHTNPGLVLRAASTPVVQENHVWVGTADGRILDLDAHTGAVRWEQVIAAPEGRTDIQRMVDITATPIVDGGMLYVATYQGQVAALSAQTGNLLWRHASSVYQDLALDSTALYFVTTDGALCALDKRAGTVRWEKSIASIRATTSPVLVGDDLIVGDDAGYVHWLSKEDGQWHDSRKMMREPIRAILRVSGQLIIMGVRGTLVAFTYRG